MWMIAAKSLTIYHCLVTNERMYTTSHNMSYINKYHHIIKNKKDELYDVSNEVFQSIPNKMHIEQMTELLSTKNIKNIADGKADRPKVHQESIITGM